MKLPQELTSMKKRALEDPESFWGEVAEGVNWFKKWERALEWNYPFFRWFIGGRTNLSYNCLDHNVKTGRGDHTAIIWYSAETGETRTFTYSRLLHEVEQFSAGLKALGVEKGDRITIYLPMVPEAAVAMLATVRLGAIHSVVFGGFGSAALTDRIVQADSKVVVTADLGYRKGKTIPLKEVVDEALAPLNMQQRVVVLRRGETEPLMKSGRDIYWEEVVDMGKGARTEAVQMEANEPAFILFTSGTTAKPKGTVHVHGGYQVFIHAMGRWVYDIRNTDVWWGISDVGWMVGHSYVVHAPLLAGCTSVMYEGTLDYPSPDMVWRVIEGNRVTKLWISPTGVRTLMKYGDEWPQKYDLSSLRLVPCAGEVLNPAAWEWMQNKVLRGRVPVIDHMWQTESAGPMVGIPYGICMLPVKPGSAGIPLPGIDGDVVDMQGNSLGPGERGIFVCHRPFPGLTPALWRDEERYVRDYWGRIPNCYYTGDAAMKDEDGYIWFLGRADEIIKISAHRIGTIEIENVLVSHPAVAEAAVVGRPDPTKGEVAAAFVVLKADRSPTDQLKSELRQTVRSKMGAIVVMDDVRFVKVLPKTRSGKIMRRLIRAAITGQPLGDYSTIEDEASMDEVRKAAAELAQALQ